jgi:rifampicin phosphotransferase
VYRIVQGQPVLEDPRSVGTDHQGSFDPPSTPSSHVPPLLASPERLELAWIVRRIHFALGDGQDPQDVEWAHDGHAFWILQSRPITALPRAGSEALRRLPQYWSRGNIKDSVPGVLCELSWSALQELVDTVAFAAVTVSRYPVPEGLEFVRRFHGRAYFDFTAMLWMFFDAFGVPPDVSARAVGGHQPGIDVPAGNPLKGSEGRRRRAASLRLFRALWNFEKKHTPGFRRHIAEMRSAAREPLELKTTGELKALLEVVHDRQHELALTVGLANAAYGRWLTPLEEMLKRPLGSRGSAVIAALSSGSGDVTSAEQGYRVSDLAQLAQTDRDALEWLLANRDPHAWTTLPPGSPFRRAFQGFLDEFGHRAALETDAANPRWVEDPSTLLAMIREQIAAHATADPRDRARERYRLAEVELRAKLPLLAPAARWMARGLRRAWAARELGKSALVAAVLPLRHLVLEIGRRLAAAGQLETPEQVFDLTSADLGSWLDGRWDGRGADELTTDRRLRREAWLQEEAADVIAGEGAAAVAAPSPQSPTNGVWRGIAVSSGHATGPARIVRSPEDAAHLTYGDILVAPSTDPGWTPLFLRASAVVMETGGYLSHGAIVAREYGLPAVVNIPGFLRQVNDGDTLDVNGDEGTVARVLLL